MPVWWELVAVARETYHAHPLDLTPAQRRRCRTWIALDRIKREAGAED